MDKKIEPDILGLEGFFEVSLKQMEDCEHILDYLETLSQFGPLTKSNMEQYEYFLDCSDTIRDRLTSVFKEQWYRKLGKYD